MKNPIFEYWEQIESGAVVVSDKVRRVYKRRACTDVRIPWCHR